MKSFQNYHKNFPTISFSSETHPKHARIQKIRHLAVRNNSNKYQSSARVINEISRGVQQ